MIVLVEMVRLEYVFWYPGGPYGEEITSPTVSSLTMDRGCNKIDDVIRSGRRSRQRHRSEQQFRLNFEAPKFYWRTSLASGVTGRRPTTRPLVRFSFKQYLFLFSDRHVGIKLVLTEGRRRADRCVRVPLIMHPTAWKSPCLLSLDDRVEGFKVLPWGDLREPAIRCPECR